MRYIAHHMGYEPFGAFVLVQAGRLLHLHPLRHHHRRHHHTGVLELTREQGRPPPLRLRPRLLPRRRRSSVRSSVRPEFNRLSQALQTLSRVSSSSSASYWCAPEPVATGKSSDSEDITPFVLRARGAVACLAFLWCASFPPAFFNRQQTRCSQISRARL